MQKYLLIKFSYDTHSPCVRHWSAKLFSQEKQRDFKSPCLFWNVQIECKNTELLPLCTSFFKDNVFLLVSPQILLNWFQLWMVMDVYLGRSQFFGINVSLFFPVELSSILSSQYTSLALLETVRLIKIILLHTIQKILTSENFKDCNVLEHYVFLTGWRRFGGA